MEFIKKAIKVHKEVYEYTNQIKCDVFMGVFDDRVVLRPLEKVIVSLTK